MLFSKLKYPLLMIIGYVLVFHVGQVQKSIIIDRVTSLKKDCLAGLFTISGGIYKEIISSTLSIIFTIFIGAIPLIIVLYKFFSKSETLDAPRSEEYPDSPVFSKLLKSKSETLDVPRSEEYLDSPVFSKLLKLKIKQLLAKGCNASIQNEAQSNDQDGPAWDLQQKFDSLSDLQRKFDQPSEQDVKNNRRIVSSSLQTSAQNSCPLDLQHAEAEEPGSAPASPGMRPVSPDSRRYYFTPI